MNKFYRICAKLLAITIVLQGIATNGTLTLAAELGNEIGYVMKCKTVSFVDTMQEYGENIKETLVDLLPDDTITSEQAISIMDIPENNLIIPDEYVINIKALPDYVRDILEDYTYYDVLEQNQKYYLKEYLGVREDTMIALEEKGFTITESIPKAIIMQQLNISAEDVIDMIFNFGSENIAKEQAQAFRELQFEYNYLMEEDVCTEMVESLITGHDAESMAEAYVIAQCMNKSLAETIGDNGTSQSAIEVYSLPEMNSFSETIEKRTMLLPEEIGEEIIRYNSIEELADAYSTDENIINEFINDNEISLDELQTEINNFKTSTGVMAASSETDEETGDDYRFEGPFTYKSGLNDSVNINSGALIYTEDIVNIPGINGLDLNLGLNYNSGDKHRNEGNDYELSRASKEVWNFNLTRLTNKFGGNLVTGLYGSASKLVLGDGSEYILGDKNNGVYDFENYNYDDLELSVVTNNEVLNASFKLKYIDGTKEYFNSAGKLIRKEDRFGNAIIVNHTSNGINILCTNGSAVSIVYTEYSEGSGSSIKYYKNMTVTIPTGETIIYKFRKYITNSGKSQGYIWVLDQKTDNRIPQSNKVTKYDYSYGSYIIYGGRYKSDKKYTECKLEKVTYPTGLQSRYAYEKGKTPSLDDNGVNAEYSRIDTKWLSYDGSDCYNKEYYDYSEANYTGYYDTGEESKFSEYTVTVTNDNSLECIYSFDKYGANTSIVKKDKSNIKSPTTLYERYMSYDTFEYDGEKYTYPNPYFVLNETLGTTGKEKYEYDIYGRVKSYWGPLSTVSYTNRNTDTEHKVGITYGDNNIILTKTYKQNSTTTIVETNTVGNYTLPNNSILAGVVTQSEVTSNGITVAKKNYGYESNGNINYIKEYINATNKVETNIIYVNNNNYAGTITKGGTSIGYTYDSMGRIHTMTDGNGKTTTYDYDAMGSVKKVVNTDNTYIQNEYNYVENTIITTDERNNKQKYVYDKAGNLLKIIDVTGGNVTLETNTYDDYMRPDINIKGGKTKTDFDYDAYDRVTAKTIYEIDSTEKQLHKETYAYTASDGCDSVYKTIKGDTNNPDMVVTTRYDNQGQMKNQNTYGRYIKYSYDYLGNRIKEEHLQSNGSDVNVYFDDRDIIGLNQKTF